MTISLNFFKVSYVHNENKSRDLQSAGPYTFVLLLAYTADESI